MPTALTPNIELMTDEEAKPVLTAALALLEKSRCALTPGAHDEAQQPELATANAIIALLTTAEAKWDPLLHTRLDVAMGTALGILLATNPCSLCSLDRIVKQAMLTAREAGCKFEHLTIADVPSPADGATAH